MLRERVGVKSISKLRLRHFYQNSLSQFYDKFYDWIMYVKNKRCLGMEEGRKQWNVNKDIDISKAKKIIDGLSEEKREVIIGEATDLISLIRNVKTESFPKGYPMKLENLVIVMGLTAIELGTFSTYSIRKDIIIGSNLYQAAMRNFPEIKGWPEWVELIKYAFPGIEEEVKRKSQINEDIDVAKAIEQIRSLREGDIEDITKEVKQKIGLIRSGKLKKKPLSGFFKKLDNLVIAIDLTVKDTEALFGSAVFERDIVGSRLWYGALTYFPGMKKRSDWCKLIESQFPNTVNPIILKKNKNKSKERKEWERQQQEIINIINAKIRISKGEILLELDISPRELTKHIEEIVEKYPQLDLSSIIRNANKNVNITKEEIEELSCPFCGSKVKYLRRINGCVMVLIAKCEKCERGYSVIDDKKTIGLKEIPRINSIFHHDCNNALLCLSGVRINGHELRTCYRCATHFEFIPDETTEHFEFDGGKRIEGK